MKGNRSDHVRRREFFLFAKSAFLASPRCAFRLQAARVAGNLFDFSPAERVRSSRQDYHPLNHISFASNSPMNKSAFESIDVTYTDAWMFEMTSRMEGLEGERTCLKTL